MVIFPWHNFHITNDHLMWHLSKNKSGIENVHNYLLNTMEYYNSSTLWRSKAIKSWSKKMNYHNKSKNKNNLYKFQILKRKKNINSIISIKQFPYKWYQYFCKFSHALMIPLCYVCLLKYSITIFTLNRRMYGLTTINDFHLEKKSDSMYQRGFKEHKR